MQYKNYSYILDGVLAQGGKPPLNAKLYPQFTTLVLMAYEICEEPAYADPRAFKPLHVLRVPIDDAKPTSDELRRVIVASYNVTNRLKNSERCLVTCAQGRNRSGLLNAFVLINLGMNADHAIRLIQKRRPTSLQNEYFNRAIRQYAKLPKLASASVAP